MCLKSFYLKYSDRLISFLGFVFWPICLVVLAVVGYSLNKGLIFSDEAFYLMHLGANVHEAKFSFWSDYANLFYPQQIVAIRVLTVSLLVLSGIVFSIGFSRFFNANFFKTILPVSVFGVFFLWSPVCLVPNYITFNAVIFFSGLGLFLLSISKIKKYWAFTFAILSGVVFSQLVFIMITNTPIILLLMLAYLFLCDSKSCGFRFSLFFGLGLLLGLALFFVFVIPVGQYFVQLHSANESLKYDSSHGIRDLIKWCFDTIFFAISEILVPAILLLFLITGDKAKNLYQRGLAVLS